MCTTKISPNQNFFPTAYVLTRRFIGTLKVLLLISLIYAPASVYAQGKLDQSKEEIKKGRDYNSDDKEDNSKNRSENSIVGAFLTEVFLSITYHAFIGDHEYEYHLQNYLSRHPYFNDASGNYVDFHPGEKKEKKFRFDVENSVIINFNQTVGNHLNLKVRPFNKFYFQSEFIRLIEIPTPDNSVAQLSLYDLNFCYDRLRFEKFNLGWSVGFNYMGDEVNKFGFSFGFSAEYFFLQPLSVSSSYRFGGINGVPVDQFDFKLKYHNSRFFYLLGYEYYKLATPRYSFIALGAGLYL
jgi:hypothetical protein